MNREDRLGLRMREGDRDKLSVPNQVWPRRQNTVFQEFKRGWSNQGKWEHCRFPPEPGLSVND